MVTCCICRCVKDVKPSPFDYRNAYQQVEVVRRCRGTFRAEAVEPDGFPPLFLRRKGWQAHTSVPTHYHLGEALGVDADLRRQMPGLKFPISSKRSPTLVVGKWYCPYVFVKEDDQTNDQMERSMFYEMTLEQFWEQIYTRENYCGLERNAVDVGVSVIREVPLVNSDHRAVVDCRGAVVDGIVWFKPVNSTAPGFGLSLPIWERMRWEQERGGWACDEQVERVERVCEGNDGWRMFGCFVLVERFVLKRMDGSLALAYDFKHTNKVRTRWE